MKKLQFAIALSLASIAFAQGTGTPTTAPKPTTTPTSPVSVLPSTTRPSFDPNNGLNNGSGIMGRIVPNQGNRMVVDIYRDGSRVDQVISDTDGSFRSTRAHNSESYEIRIVLGTNSEFREDIHFDGNFPSIVQINVSSKIHELTPGAVPSGGMVSMANLKAPKKAVSEYEKGSELGDKKKYDEALVHLQKSVEIYPAYPNAYNEMGLIHRRQEHLDEAAAMFAKAIEADPKWVSPYLNIAQMQFNKPDYPALLKTSTKVIELDASNATAHFFSAVANMSAGKMDVAEKEALEAQKQMIHPIPQVHLVLARIYELRGATTDAVEQYKNFVKVSPKGPGVDKITEHIAKLEHP